MHPELGSVCQEDGLGVGSFFGACDAASGEIQFRGTAWARGGCVLRIGTGVMVQGPPVPGPSQCKPYSEVQVVCLLREAMGKNVGVTHR